ncbi:type II secretory pathway component PulF [Bacillus sp. V2I10]|nr:type II secretion system F family protein [Bacillus sp. V2I10]MDQ0858209.1 type II secretory pathway component PulF [Bacillus sp. V2I10]
MKDHWFFPPLVTRMIAIGEESGLLNEMYSKMADFCEGEAEQAADRLKSLIEPLIIVFLQEL